jgi:hypothetical protein
VTLAFPSREFDEGVSAVFHGTASDEEARALNEILRSDAAARDEYILRVELHSRLASEQDLFVSGEQSAGTAGSETPRRFGNSPSISKATSPLRSAIALQSSSPRKRFQTWTVTLAACVAVLAGGWWTFRFSHSRERKGATSKAVAMLNRVADAQWAEGQAVPKLGAPLEPGFLRLKSGLAQIVFYSGARVAVEGSAELHIISPSEASCRSGRLVAEVPPQARGFQVGTPQINVTDLGTVFALDVKDRRTELHVFKGNVEFQATAGAAKQNLKEGAGAVTENSRPPILITADPKAFASLFDLQFKSSAAEVVRHEQWRAASSRRDEDPSLLVHFDFEQADTSEWRLLNASGRKNAAPDGTIVGCQWTEGRWPDKHALEFRSVNDRVRLSVPGECEALTLAAWVRVQGLDRQINSLFMSDGFEAGTVHWSIRHDGVLALTAIGSEPGDYQICTSPPALALNQFGLWLHLAVVIDGGAKQVVHYLNGVPESEQALNIKPPFRVGVAELGNWNAKGFPKNDPFMIRNFGGAMDEFYLFSRALSAEEIRALYSSGKPQPDPVAELKTN